MEADERLTALKKAYADIILNTAKEAAARIMMSERKALRFQHELQSSKEEAVRMLLRLKQMMDSKISEAEITSFNQQKKIEELEAQLQEAEDIVKDLREELREVQAELERMANNKVQPQDEHDTPFQEKLPEANVFYTHSTQFPPSVSPDECLAASDVTIANLSETNENHTCYSKIVQIGNSFLGNSDLPAIILRSKEPEMYRNGCTQRIRACERNLLERELALSGQIKNAQDEMSAQEGEEDKEIQKTAIHESNDMSNCEKKVMQEDSGLSSWHPIKSLHRKKKRAARYGRNIIQLSKKPPAHFLETNQVPDVSCVRTDSRAVEDNAKSIHNLPKMGARVSMPQSESDIQQGCAEALKGEPELKVSCNMQNGSAEDEQLMENAGQLGEETRSLESPGLPICKVDLENGGNMQLVSESKSSNTTKEIPSPTVNDRVIKYTFQRKRKRESLSLLGGNGFLEKCSSKKKMGEEQNSSLESQNSSSITELSRDSRRMAQVARQLISLSEKKWWQ